MNEVTAPEERRGVGDVRVTAVVMPDTTPLSTKYRLSPEQTVFFKSQIGIDDENELKKHILDVQEKAYKIFPYPCIRLFTFLEHGMALHAYNSVLKLGRERSDGILLDIGACYELLTVGVDSRKAAADGYPLKNIVTTDLHQEFFDLGHDLFKTTPTSYPIDFVAGDIFKPDMLQVFPPFDGPPSTKRPDLSALTSLDPLAGHCAAIYAGNFFHLFSEGNQHHLARALAGLLSHLPGSMIFGVNVSNLQKGDWTLDYAGRTMSTFCHSPETWAALWDGQIFVKGKVKIDTTLEKVDKGLGLEYWQMKWSVVRL